jgi:hypothetical protein
MQEDVVERVPFLLMGLELPPTPLFKDALEKNIIPQVRLQPSSTQKDAPFHMRQHMIL